MAPAYTLVGLGFDYKPSDKFTLFVSPVTARLVIVNDETLWYGSTDPELRVYGVKNGETTSLGVGDMLVCSTLHNWPRTSRS